MSQASWFKSSSGEPATKSSVSAAWCHTVPGSAGTTEYTFPFAALKNYVPNCSIPLAERHPGPVDARRAREVSGAGAGVPAAGEAQAGMNGFLQAQRSGQPGVPSPDGMTRADRGFNPARSVWVRGRFATRKQTGSSREEAMPRSGQILSRCWHIRTDPGFTWAGAAWVSCCRPPFPFIHALSSDAI